MISRVIVVLITWVHIGEAEECDQTILNLSSDLILDSLVNQFPEQASLGLGAFASVILEEGTVTLRKGNFVGLQTLERKQNVAFNVTGHKLQLNYVLKFGNLSINYGEYDIAYKNIRRTGELVLTGVDDVILSREVSDSNLCASTIDALSVTAKKLDVDLSSCQRCDVLTKKVEAEVSKVINKYLFPVIKENLEEYLRSSLNISEEGYCKKHVGN